MSTVYILVDLEGISGVSYGGMIRTGSSDWFHRGRHMATAEVNAAIEGALAGGATRILVRDSHDSGENLISEELHPGAELISGAIHVSPLLRDLDEAVSSLFFVGFHARMGTADAHFDHTITTASVSELRLNDVPVGEIGHYAAYAGHVGVPVKLVTGDQAAVHEARELFGAIESVAVKVGHGRFSARLRSPQECRADIRDAAERAMAIPGTVWDLATPLVAEVDFLRSAEADQAETVPGAERTGPRTVRYAHADPSYTFKAIDAMVRLGGLAANRWARALYGTGSPVA